MNTIVFERRWRIASDGFGLQRDDEGGAYVHIDDAVDAIGRAITVAQDAIPAPEGAELTEAQIIAAWDAQSRFHGHEPCKLGHLEFARAVIAADRAARPSPAEGDVRCAACDKPAVTSGGTFPTCPCGSKSFNAAIGCAAPATNLAKRDEGAEFAGWREWFKNTNGQSPTPADAWHARAGIATKLAARTAPNVQPKHTAYQGPKKWTDEEIERGYVGIRWVNLEGVSGRPTTHDLREELERALLVESRVCDCNDCKAAPSPAPAHELTDEQIDALLPVAKLDLVTRGSISTGGGSYGREMKREPVWTQQQVRQAIRAAIASTAVQAPAVAHQPAAWVRWEWNRSGSKSLVFDRPTELSLFEEARGVIYDPLYARNAAAPEPLTDEQAGKLITDAAGWQTPLSAHYQIVRAVERAYGITPKE